MAKVPMVFNFTRLVVINCKFVTHSRGSEDWCPNHPVFRVSFKLIKSVRVAI
uniref:Uncharacterized protein n=1 Tax=Arundo donax TaxID=35708 RepID=A0A0A9FZ18_ARUDO